MRALICKKTQVQFIHLNRLYWVIYLLKNIENKQFQKYKYHMHVKMIQIGLEIKELVSRLNTEYFIMIPEKTVIFDAVVIASSKSSYVSVAFTTVCTFDKCEKYRVFSGLNNSNIMAHVLKIPS